MSSQQSALQQVVKSKSCPQNFLKTSFLMQRQWCSMVLILYDDQKDSKLTDSFMEKSHSHHYPCNWGMLTHKRNINSADGSNHHYEERSHKRTVCVYGRSIKQEHAAHRKSCKQIKPIEHITGHWLSFTVWCHLTRVQQTCWTWNKKGTYLI